MYLSISRKYRPKTFSEVFGQSVSSKILINSILMDRVIKTMLITGIRGTGKTTLARLYGKALNCDSFSVNNDVCCNCQSCLEAQNGSHPDILEFDAASHNGVDFVRDLEVLISQKPNYKTRVIIFDEAHMFSKQAQAALLKLLEECSSHLQFILVTTNPEALIDTVRSRCLSMPLRSLTPLDVENNIKYILKSEGLRCADGFIETLSRVGGGSLRDVQQILDQCILAAGNDLLTSKYLEESVGIVSVDQYRKLAAVISRLDPKISLENVNKWYRDGTDLELLFSEGIPNLLRDFSMVLSNCYYEDMYMITGLDASLIKNKLTLSYDQVKMILDRWEDFIDMMKSSSQPKLIWELFLIQICEVSNVHNG